MRVIDCFKCGKKLITLEPGSLIIKEGLRAFCLTCSEQSKENNSNKNRPDFSFEDLFNSFKPGDYKR